MAVVFRDCSSDYGHKRAISMIKVEVAYRDDDRLVNVVVGMEQIEDGIWIDCEKINFNATYTFERKDLRTGLTKEYQGCVPQLRDGRAYFNLNDCRLIVVKAK